MKVYWKGTYKLGGYGHLVDVTTQLMDNNQEHILLTLAEREQELREAFEAGYDTCLHGVNDQEKNNAFQNWLAAREKQND